MATHPSALVSANLQSKGLLQATLYDFSLNRSYAFMSDSRKRLKQLSAGRHENSGGGRLRFSLFLHWPVCPQWASRGCLRNINLNTCSRLLPVPKTAVKSKWGCKLWAPAGFRSTNAHRPLWEVPLSPGCRIQRVIQVQQLWGVRPCVSDPNLQTFGSLQYLEYTWPLVGIDILVNSSAWWWNTNIWLAIAGSGELLACEYVLLMVFKETKDYLTGRRTIFL